MSLTTSLKPLAAIVIVLVAPVPDAVTPLPTKFKVVPAVDNELPSSCTVTPPEIPVKAEPSRAGKAPVIFAAGIAVKFAAEAAGSVAGNLASGIVPAFKFEASPAVKPPEVPVVFWFKVAILAAAIVPEAILLPFKAVRFTPLAVGNVAGNLASGIVPEL